MITQNDIDSGRVYIGSRVFYARKDGRRIYGTVRAIYADKKTLSLKPDMPINPTYRQTDPQTFRFRRLYTDTFELFGLQVAPLVLLAAKNEDKEYRKVFSTRDGLMATDKRRYFVEKTPGLGEGYLIPSIDGVSLFEISNDSIRGMVFPVSLIRHTIGQKPVDEYYAANQLGIPQGKAKVDQVEFNRQIKALAYSSGYSTKHSDMIELVIANKTMSYILFNRKGEQYGKGSIDNGIIKITGGGTIKCLLYDMKEFTRRIRTKSYEIEWHKGRCLKIETEEQLRIQTRNYN